ncbi:hypothetical protein Sjap_008489 [Stephania japonica]|uniref:Uncharacterized protein n=1 Tax=Stephania japonica TaxID=461633 RepID=A0AAP0JRV7_9MAGN
MAEEILVNGAGEILKLLTSKAIDEIKLVKGVKKEVEKLEAVAKKIQEVIEDAEKKQVDDVSVRQWLQDLKDVAYWAEDILDEITYESLRRQVETHGRLKNKVRDFFSRFNPLVFRIKMAHKIKDVNLKLGEIEKQKQRFKFDVNPALPLASSSSRANRETGSLVDDSEVFGRKDDKSKIVEMLLAKRNVEDALSVIPIVGFGGLGKTTLAQLVYNDVELQGKYDLKMWVYVSETFDVKKVLKDMLDSISKTKFEVSSLDVMQTSLRDELNKKTFLLVLDDMWNDSQLSDKWDALRMCFKFAAHQGSRVMVTTRSREVASTVGTLPTYDLQVLLSDDCWNLFEKRVFSFGGPEKTHKLEAIGRRIVEKCAGVPLALKALGGVMHSKHGEKEWVDVQNSSIWAISDADKKIMSVLKLSFDSLAPPLKQCFLYCSIIPKGIVIEKAWMVQLWMAEGLLGSLKRTESMENIGNEYFKCLCLNSLFQDAKKNKFGAIETFKIHDLVYDLITSISGIGCLFLKTSETLIDVSKTHWLGLHFDEPRIPKALHQAKKLRSFSACGANYEAVDEDFDDLLLNFLSLRVLELSFAGIKLLPASIGKLKHLRFLDVSSTRIEELPKSVTCLYNLQTLRMKNCDNLKVLPRDLRKLINLRHLEVDISGEWREMPKGIGQLTCLQTLPVFQVGHNDDDGCTLAELEHLNLLRGQLGIYDLDNVKNVRYAEKANLKAKKDLYTLSLEWDRDEGDEEDGTNSDKLNDGDVLEALQPPFDLKELWVNRFRGSRFPRWIQNSSALRGLVDIYFQSCSRCVFLPSFGKLPSLKTLYINDMRNVKRFGGAWNEGMDNPKVEIVEEVGNSDMAEIMFPSLKSMYLVNMPNLEEWLEPMTVTSFPILETLIIKDCLKLRITPSSFPSLKTLQFQPITSGIAVQSLTKNLTSLTHLYVDDCLHLKSLPEELLLNNRFLYELTLKGCPEFEGFLPKESHTHGGSSFSSSVFIPNEGLGALQLLDIRQCPKFHVMPNTLPSLSHLVLINSNNHFMGWVSSKVTSLTYLWIEDIPDMLSLPSELLKNNKLLKELGICKCPQLQEVDEKSVLQSFNRLVGLVVQGCHGLKSLNVQGLDSLKTVEITKCKGLNSFPEGVSLLPHLYRLRIGELWEEELHYFPFPTTERGHFLSLRHLEIRDSPNMKSPPHQLQQLIRLKTLLIENFYGVTELPEWIGNLASLEYLGIWTCANLTHLSSMEAMRRLTSLGSLEIKNCPLLKEKCERGGQEWPKISHIQNIKIVDGVIPR